MQTQAKIAIIILVLGFLGFLDASYLTAEHYLKGPIPCGVGNCEKVLTSSYATFLGVPVALFGAVLYLAIVVLAVGYLTGGHETFLNIILFLTVLGFLAAIWFVYLQLFVLRAICPFCISSEIISTLLFSASLYAIKDRKSLAQSN